MAQRLPDEQEEQSTKHGADEHSGWKHWGMMALCCAPMIAIVIWIAVRAWA